MMHKVGAVLLCLFSAASMTRTVSAQAGLVALGDTGGASSASPSEAEGSSAAEPLAVAPVAYGGQVTQTAMAGRSGPIASTAFGAMYYQTNLTDVYAGHPAQYALGWYGIQQVNFTKSLGVMVDFDNTYNLHGVNGANTHAMMAGPVLSLKTKWVRPYVFALGGAVRTSYQGALVQTPAGFYRENGFVEWDADAAGGIGMNFKLSHNVAFQFIPGEYVATRIVGGDWVSNYQAKVGLVLNMYGNRAH